MISTVYVYPLVKASTEASPVFGRGGERIFFSDLETRMAKPCALPGGFGGMLPDNFFKTVQFGAF